MDQILTRAANGDGRRADRWRVVGVAVAGLISTPACRQPLTEIVLTVDTDLAVAGELDHVKIDIQGSSADGGSLFVDVAATDAPTFPLSLGLESGGTLGPVDVSVEAWRGGSAAVGLHVRTAFVRGESRTMPLFLTMSCMGQLCQSDETCSLGSCVPVDRPGTSLPAWTGRVPPPMDLGPLVLARHSVWAMGWHSCAARGNTLSCWGRNDSGELGTGFMGSVPTRRAPLGLPTPTSVGLGETHTCICDALGKAYCWGGNTEGQVGAGDLLPHLTPTAVVGVSDCKGIAGGGFHTCAVINGDNIRGGVACWGRNVEGQLGQPVATVPMRSMTAMMVPNLDSVDEVQAGEKFTCAHRTNSSIVCWGDNSNGQLGDGTTTSRDAPVRVMNVQMASELAAGRFFACARLATGKVSCWGQNSAGAIGTAASPVKVPVEIPGIDGDAQQIATGHDHACVLRQSGVVYCWGGNQYGQLGANQGLNSPVPVAVTGLGNDVTSIATGFVHSCARSPSGLYCWGQNILQQLGDGSGAAQSQPVAVVGF